MYMYIYIYIYICMPLDAQLSLRPGEAVQAERVAGRGRGGLVHVTDEDLSFTLYHILYYICYNIYIYIYRERERDSIVVAALFNSL